MQLFFINNRLINVSLIFLISYIVVHLLYLFFTYFCAILIDLPEATFYFAYIDYDVSLYKSWSRLRVVLLFGVPTFMMIVLALGSWVMMKKFSFYGSSKVKLFFLWSILSSLSFVISDFVSAPFYRHGISVVADWFYIKKETMFIISLLFWAIIPFVSWSFSKTFMKIAYSRRFLLTKWTRMSFLANTILLPYLLVAVLVAALLIYSPGYNLEYYLSIDFIRVFVLLSMVGFIFIFNFHKRYMAINRNRELEHLNYSFIFVSLLSMSVIYLVLYLI
ncbi:MAG: hypothetical protein ACI8V8_000035 [Chitinophagales bacterium]|jgi:hypothetical protein